MKAKLRNININSRQLVLIPIFTSSILLSACGSDNDNSTPPLQPVEDTTAPVITIAGDASINVNNNATYTDAGATATDNVDGTVAVTTTGTVDITTVGSYELTYTATDAAGNSSTLIRTVNVLDNTAPVLSLTGASSQDLLLGATFTDAGATATDDVDETVNVVVDNPVDTSILGLYTVTYTATDAAGNSTNITRTVNVVAPVLSGTAAAGAAIVGTVTIKDSLGATRSELIEADGSYSVDVTGLTPPFRLRAEGTVGGKNYRLHSYAEDAEIDNKVNITPFTDLIIANAAQQIAEEFFNEATPTPLEADDIVAQEEALQDKLQDVFDALGLDDAINLLNTAFSADHSGLDAALDIIQIETDPDSNIATISNLLDDTSIEDDITDDESDDVVLVVDEDDLTEAVTDTQAIAATFSAFSAAFTDGLPTPNSITPLFGDIFLHQDQSLNQFLTDITTDPSLTGLSFSSVSIRDLDSETGTATVDFNVTFKGVIEAESETWQVAKDSELGWQLLGNQQFFEAETLTFHCNDHDGLDDSSGGCGINVSFYDNDFSNNGTDNQPLASAIMSIIDGDDSETVKAVVYLGTSEYGGAGELSVYNPSTGEFQGDYAGFGTSLGEVDPSIFAIGDIVRYQLYVDELDLTDETNPAVSIGNEVASFDRSVVFLPETSGRNPMLTADGLAAFNNFSPANDLTASWQVANDTLIESILISIYDNQGNNLEIEDESMAVDATSTVLDSSTFATDLASDLDFNQLNYTLLVRVYAFDPSTGQVHSTDYRKSFVTEPNNTSCDTESNWDDENDKPTEFYSINDFKASVADCESQGDLPSFSMAELANETWYVDDEHLTFDATGANFVLTSYGDDEEMGTNDDETFYGIVSEYDTNVFEFTYSATENGTPLGRDLIRIKEERTFGNKSVIISKTLWEFYQWTESDGTNTDLSHQGGELYSETYALDSDFDWDAWETGVEPETLACSTESPWDDENDKPTVFYSINDFKEVVTSCENDTNLPNFTKSDLANIMWYVDDERIAFDATGENLVITDIGDDGVFDTNDDDTFYGVVSDYDTNIIKIAYSETQDGDILGHDLIRIKEETSFNGKGLYLILTLWEEYVWSESDSSDTDLNHKGGEIYHSAYSTAADFDWDAYENQQF